MWNCALNKLLDGNKNLIIIIIIIITIAILLSQLCT